MENLKLISVTKANSFLRIGSILGIFFFFLNFVYAFRTILANASNLELGGKSVNMYPSWLFIILLIITLLSSILIIMGLVIYYTNHPIVSKKRLILFLIFFIFFSALIPIRYIIYISQFPIGGEIAIGALYYNHIITFLITDSIVTAILTSLNIILLIISLAFFSLLFSELKTVYKTKTSGFLISSYINGLTLVFYLVSLIVCASLFNSLNATEFTHMASYFVYASSVCFVEFAFFLSYFELSLKFILVKIPLTRDPLNK